MQPRLTIDVLSSTLQVKEGYRTVEGAENYAGKRRQDAASVLLNERRRAGTRVGQ